MRGDPILKQLTPLIYILAYVGVAFIAIMYVIPFLLPFVLAIMLSILIESPVRWLMKRARLSRAMAVLIVLLLVFGSMFTTLGLIFARLIAELVSLSVSLPEYYTRGTVLFGELMDTVNGLTASLPPPVQSMLDQQISRLYVALEKVISAVLETLKAVPGTVGVLVVTLLATFFISRDRETLLLMARGIMPALPGGKLERAQREVLDSTVGLLKAQFLLVANTTIIVMLALWLMGSRYALVMGLTIGVMDILPLLGPGLVFIPWAVYSFFLGDRVFGILLLVLYLSISAVRQVLEAKVIGEKTGIHPLATLLAMYVGVQVFGAFGLLIGPLIAIVLKAIMRAGLIPPWPGASHGTD